MLDLNLLLQLFWILTSAAFVIVTFIPPLSSRFLAYGARSASTARPSQHGSSTHTALDALASITLPHGYFTHFYALSTFLSLVCIAQLLNGRAILTLLYMFIPYDAPPAMTKPQIILLHALILAQSLRRWHESLNTPPRKRSPSSSSTTSQIWFGHYIVGLAFYTSLNVAVWAAGAPSMRSITVSWSDLTLPAPSLRTAIFLPLFVLASGAQHDAHAYLASMTTYAVPRHPLWSLCLCPHYLAECVIYIALAGLAAPRGYWWNYTLLAHALFVVVNLGITARGTRAWYHAKFGVDNMPSRWAMVPYIF